MKKLSLITAAATTGTTVMTLFSYLLTKAAKKNFVEPEIIGQLLNRVSPLNKPAARVTGWVAHYAVGELFTAGYDQYLTLKRTQPALANTLLLGLAGGATGVALWHATFKAHPNPPGVDIKNFYRQLMVAHLIFAAGVALTYKAAEPDDRSTHVDFRYERY